MFKKNLPFAVFLATLITVMVLVDGGFTLLKNQDPRTTKRMLSFLAQGHIQEANRSLTSIHFFRRLDFGTTFTSDFLNNLAACFGEKEIAIKDSTDARRYLKKIEAWPQPLKSWTKFILWHVACKITLKEVYKQKIHLIMKFDRAEWHAFDKLWNGNETAEAISTGFPLVGSLVQFYLVGPILLIVLVWEWSLERKHPQLRETFASFSLTESQKYLVVNIYFLALALTLTFSIVIPAVLLGKSLSVPLIFIAFTACLAFVLPLTILAILKFDIKKMRKGNSLADCPQGGIVQLSWIKQYKFFLWRLWPVWLVSGLAAGLLWKLYWGDQVNYLLFYFR